MNIHKYFISLATFTESLLSSSNQYLNFETRSEWLNICVLILEQVEFLAQLISIHRYIQHYKSVAIIFSQEVLIVITKSCQF